MSEVDQNPYPSRAAGYRTSRYPGFVGGRIDPNTGNLVNPSAAQVSSGLSTFRAEERDAGPTVPEFPKPEEPASAGVQLLRSGAGYAGQEIGKVAGPLVADGVPVSDAIGTGVNEVGNQVAEFFGGGETAAPSNGLTEAARAGVGSKPVEAAGTLAPPAASAPITPVTDGGPLTPIGYQSAASKPVTTVSLQNVGTPGAEAFAAQQAAATSSPAAQTAALDAFGGAGPAVSSGGGGGGAAFAGGSEVAGAGASVTPASYSSAPLEAFGGAGAPVSSGSGSSAASGVSSSGSFSGAVGAGFGAGIATAAVGLLTGQKPAQALKAGVGAGVGAAIGSYFGPVGTFVGSAIGGMIGGRVICTELADRGLLDDALLRDDLAFTTRLDPAVIRGYHRWAPTVVRWMRRDDRFGRFVTAIAQRLATWRALEVSHVMGSRERGDWRGKLVRIIGEGWCARLGRDVEEDYDWTELFLEELQHKTV